MARRFIYSSDLSGMEIPEGQHGKLRVLMHPTLDRPRELDATSLELANIKGATLEMVEIEVQIDGEPAERLFMELKSFDKLFGKGRDPQDVLETVVEMGVEAPRRRGRPAGSSGKGTHHPQTFRFW